MIRAQKQTNQKGFTLVELLMVMAIFAMLLTVLTDMFVSVLNVRTEAQANNAVVQDGRFMLSRLSYDISRASSVTTPAALGGSGATVAIVIGGVTYTYAVSGSNLQLTNAQGTTNLNSSETTVSGVTFQRIGNVSGKDTIKISLTVTSIARPDHGPKSETFTTTVGRR